MSKPRSASKRHSLAGVLTHVARAGLSAAILTAAPIVEAQTAGAGLPPSIASAGVTQADWDAVRAAVQRQARRAGIAEAALLAAAERAGVNIARSRRLDPNALRDAIIGQLETQAHIISDLEQRLEILARSEDPQIAELLTGAHLAIGAGRLEDADELLAQAEESDLAAIAVAEARAERARSRLADTIVERGRLEPALTGASVTGLDEAIARYTAALQTIDPALAPADWARTQLNLGIAYALLAQTGDRQARAKAVAALEAALEVFASLRNERSTDRTRRLLEILHVR